LKIKFEIEITKDKEMEEGTYLKIKKIDGITSLFREMTRNIISLLN
jgi:hypothetical protein